MEAPGTGTPLGDPIEVNALEAVYGMNRGTENPLTVGSVKTNIGHTEAAAGIAGLMKVVLSLQHGYIPPHLHFQAINPHLAAARHRITIPDKGRDWIQANTAQPRRAGVSSFGFSGTNAHAILEEAPIPQKIEKRLWRPYHLLTLSAQNESDLSTLASSYMEAISTCKEEAFVDFCYATNTSQVHLKYRHAIVANSAGQMTEKLNHLVTQHLQHEQPVQDRLSSPLIAFLFSGQGTQYIYQKTPLCHPAHQLR